MGFCYSSQSRLIHTRAHLGFPLLKTLQQLPITWCSEVLSLCHGLQGPIITSSMTISPTSATLPGLPSSGLTVSHSVLQRSTALFSPRAFTQGVSSARKALLPRSCLVASTWSSELSFNLIAANLMLPKIREPFHVICSQLPLLLLGSTHLSWI